MSRGNHGLRALALCIVFNGIVGVLAPQAIAGSSDASAASESTIASWNGFYLGGHLGYAWGEAEWTAGALSGGTPAVSGSFGMFQPFDAFTEAGSFFEGLQVGYNDRLPGRIVVGIEADASYPGWPNLQGISIGGASDFHSASLGATTYRENVTDFGTLRGRIGYAPGNWLLYATGGLPGPMIC
jgi:high affinity Mn2+ porin